MGSRRFHEYIPFPAPDLPDVQGDEYVAFIADTLKPIIDRDFRTLTDAASTGIAGSSLGGLISLYAFFREPLVFGFAGVMSPALWFANGAIFEYVASQGDWNGRIYVDVGTGEGRPTVRNARLMARVLRRSSSRPRLDVMYVEGRGAAHNETAWADRFERAVRFLLPRAPADLHW